MKVRIVVALVSGASFGPAWAQEPVVDEAVVLQCFENGQIRDDVVPECVGDAMSLCLDQFGTTTVDMMQCGFAETEVWDRLLNEIYGTVRPALAARDAQFGYEMSTAEALRTAQRAWIAYRDAECTLQWSIYQHGTIRGPIAAGCQLQMTARRAFEIRALLEP